MFNFNDALLQIYEKIPVKDKDRQPYSGMFLIIKNWLIEAMCAKNPVFRNIFKGVTSCDIYPNFVRCTEPNEFDVFLLLKFPFNFLVTIDSHQPGYVEIKSNNLEMISDIDMKNTFKERIFKDENLWSILNPINLHNWFQEILTFVLHNTTFPTGYEINCESSKVSLTIKATAEQPPFRHILINFIPAITLNEDNLDQKFKTTIDSNPNYVKSFVAIPEPLENFPSQLNRNYGFLLINPAVERNLIWDKKNLMITYQLIKALRDNYINLYGLQNNFLTSIFLLEVNKMPLVYWQQMDLTIIFFHMVNKIIEYLKQRCLPFYWTQDVNLLSILNKKQIKQQISTLTNVYDHLYMFSAPEQNVPYSLNNYFKTKQ